MNYLKAIDYNDLKFIIIRSGVEIAFSELKDLVVLFYCIRKCEISIEETRHKQE